MAQQKKKKRSGKNPTKVEFQLRAMLLTAQSTISELDKTNKILSGEASAVLEALWNGYQELTLVATDIVRRVAALEDLNGIVNEKEEEDEQEENATTETTGDGTDDISESEPEGEGGLHSGPEGEKLEEVPGTAGEGSFETETEGGGA